MKNFLFTAAVIFIIALNISAQTKNERAQNQIRQVLDAQTRAWNNGDIEGFMRGYWNSPDLVFASGDSITKGWQPTFDRYKKRYDTRAKMGTLTFSDLEIEILSKDWAKVLGSWSLQREADNPKGKFTLIFRRFKDGWKVVHDHTS